MKRKVKLSSISLDKKVCIVEYTIVYNPKDMEVKTDIYLCSSIDELASHIFRKHGLYSYDKDKDNSTYIHSGVFFNEGLNKAKYRDLHIFETDVRFLPANIDMRCEDVLIGIDKINKDDFFIEVEDEFENLLNYDEVVDIIDKRLELYYDTTNKEAENIYVGRKIYALFLDQVDSVFDVDHIIFADKKIKKLTDINKMSTNSIIVIDSEVQ